MLSCHCQQFLPYYLDRLGIGQAAEPVGLAFVMRDALWDRTGKRFHSQTHGAFPGSGTRETAAVADWESIRWDWHGNAGGTCV